MRLILEEQLKYLQSFINNATYYLMNSNADVTHQAVNLFSSGKCFTCFISDCPHYIWWNFIIIPKYEHIIAPYVLSTSFFTRIVQTVLCLFRNQRNSLYNPGKDRCTQYMWSNDMFVRWNHISATFYEDRVCCLHIFPK